MSELRFQWTDCMHAKLYFMKLDGSKRVFLKKKHFKQHFWQWLIFIDCGILFYLCTLLQWLNPTYLYNFLAQLLFEIRSILWGEDVFEYPKMYSLVLQMLSPGATQLCHLSPDQSEPVQSDRSQGPRWRLWWACSWKPELSQHHGWHEAARGSFGYSSS